MDFILEDKIKICLFRKKSGLIQPLSNINTPLEAGKIPADRELSIGNVKNNLLRIKLFFF